MNTAMSYMYRDGSNYKDYTNIVLAGEITDIDRDVIQKSLDGGVYFIPEQVGLPANRLDQYSRDEDDHPYCELDPIYGFKLTSADPTEEFTMEELVAAFAAVTVWDESFVEYGGE